MSFARRVVTLVLGLVMLIAFARPLAAQVEGDGSGVSLLSPYVGVAVEPGDTATFDLTLKGSEGEKVGLEISDLPSGWSARIRGGGFIVDSVTVGEGLSTALRLEIDVPDDAAEGAYRLAVIATGIASSDTLEFNLTVAQAVGGGVTLNAEFPALRGPSDVVFSYTLELRNDTTEEIQFGLQAQGPDGWQVDARPAGESRAASLTVAAGSSERITVDVDPPDTAAAGQYQAVVQAAGGGETAEAELLVQITGNFDMTLTTPDQRLNLDVEAGKPTELPLVVVNNGTAPLIDVSLSANPPRGWEVTFSPQSINGLEPGATQELTAVVTPSADAITGDYRITLTSSVAETSDSIEVRATVRTSALWGLVGVGVILVAMGALVAVFRRFGRR